MMIIIREKVRISGLWERSNIIINVQWQAIQLVVALKKKISPHCYSWNKQGEGFFFYLTCHFLTNAGWQLCTLRSTPKAYRTVSSVSFWLQSAVEYVCLIINYSNVLQYVIAKGVLIRSQIWLYASCLSPQRGANGRFMRTTNDAIDYQAGTHDSHNESTTLAYSAVLTHTKEDENHGIKFPPCSPRPLRASQQPSPCG